MSPVNLGFSYKGKDHSKQSFVCLVCMSRAGLANLTNIEMGVLHGTRLH